MAAGLWGTEFSTRRTIKVAGRLTGEGDGEWKPGAMKSGIGLNGQPGRRRTENLQSQKPRPRKTNIQNGI